MFERVKRQNIAVTMLEHEIQRENLPQVLLFYGPDGCGKFLTAIELARGVNCKAQREPGCACVSCRAIDKLIDRDLVVVSRATLRNSFDLWNRFGVRENSQTLFARDLRRFALSIADDGKHSREFLSIQDILRDPHALMERSNDILKEVYRVLDSQKQRVITIDTIREIRRFLSVKSTNGGYRIVIIDGADHMNEEASNSFLKISEDTPSDSLIILITSQRDLLKETIRSRCRSYRFVGLSKEGIREIMNLNFQSAEGMETLDLSHDRDTVEEYYNRLSTKECEVTERTSIASDIVAGDHTIGFLDYLITIITDKYHSSFHHSVEKLYKIEALLKRILFIKRAILVNSLNQESALTDFMMNGFSEVVNLEGAETVRKDPN